VVKQWNDRLWAVDPGQLDFEEVMVRKLIDEMLS
jgi:hypothetical protein